MKASTGMDSYFILISGVPPPSVFHFISDLNQMLLLFYFSSSLSECQLETLWQDFIFNGSLKLNAKESNTSNPVYVLRFTANDLMVTDHFEFVHVAFFHFYVVQFLLMFNLHLENARKRGK